MNEYPDEVGFLELGLCGLLWENRMVEQEENN